MIHQGLAKGDRVVVDGVMKVVPGQPVRIAGSATQAGAPTDKPPAAGK